MTNPMTNPMIRLAICLTLMAAAACVSPTDKTTLGSTIDADSPSILGKSRRIYPSTNCITLRGYLPFIRWSTDWPEVNNWITLTGERASIGRSGEPDIVAAWAVGHNLLPEPLTLPITPGCQLLVQPISVMFAWPRSASDPPPQAGLRLGAWSEGPTAYLIINPAPETLGISFFVQLIEVAPGENMAGLLVSHAVQLKIGNANWWTR